MHNCHCPRSSLRFFVSRTHKYLYKKSKFDEFSASSRGVHDPKLRANSSSNRNGSERSMSTSLLGGDRGVISVHVCGRCSLSTSSCCCCCSYDEMVVGVMVSGSICILRTNCLDDATSADEVLPARFTMENVAFFSSDSCRYSAVLSSRQWKKISSTQ